MRARWFILGLRSTKWDNGSVFHMHIFYSTPTRTRGPYRGRSRGFDKASEGWNFGRDPSKCPLIFLSLRLLAPLGISLAC